RFSPTPIRVRYQGNILNGNVEGRNFNVSDISIVTGGNMKAGISHVTVLSVTKINFLLPVFSLHKEGIWEKAFAKDIDFEAHPVFSGKYNLQGVNEADIRNFFSRSLIEFLEQSHEYSIDSFGNELIIYSPGKICEWIETDEMIQFGKRFLQLAELTSKS